MQKLYARDEDWEIYLGRRLRVIRGTKEHTGTLKGREEALSPMTSGEMAQAWILELESGGEHRFVPSDEWELYAELDA